MATQTTVIELKIELNFADGDTRVFRLKNPINDNAQLQQKIAEINTLILNGKLLIGDKAAGEFTGIYRATKIRRTTQSLDLQ